MGFAADGGQVAQAVSGASGSTGWPTSRAPVRRARSATSRSSRCSWRRWSASRATRRTGRGRRWPPRPGCRSRRSAGSGRRSGCKPHRVDAFKIFHRPVVHRQGARRGRAVSGSAREGAGVVCGREVPDPGPGPVGAGAADDARACPSGAPTTTSATASPPCSPPWTWPPARSIGSIHRRHRAIEFKKFLTRLDSQVPAELDVHLICDNYATHKTPRIAKWLAAHPRFHMHFTPTYSSWLNQVERWFALLTEKKLRRGAHRIDPGPGERHSRLDQRLERQPETLRLDQVRRRDPGTPRLIYSTNSWRRTLGDYLRPLSADLRWAAT